MERYICIHGHFYQPPRENPWLEEVELQDSAYPYHDWNDRITAECYAPNAASRILDSRGRIIDIVSNYSRISFNFGPTLLSWMERRRPEVHEAIVEADRQSRERFSGHGSALAQVYNHMIMPLANKRDKTTQVLWGIRDFQKRFGRDPEGMWLSETAADVETLEVLAEAGIKFTLLAPRQAKRVRPRGSEDWVDVGHGSVDPTRPYLCILPSGREITLFFYDGPISQKLAFEGLLASGENFAKALLSGFSEGRDWPQIMHIATDGESYGHHHKRGDMALAFCIHYIESNNLAKITNYGEYLERHPPTHAAEIHDNSSWSCVHGIERWKSHCGCNSGGNPGWNQEWRKPLREALDGVRDALVPLHEKETAGLLKDPWEARNGYIQIILDRSEENLNRFLSTHAARELGKGEREKVLKFLEAQRHAMLMYTSCGWFFDEISGIETVQILQYASRAMQLCLESGFNGLEERFMATLESAASNIPSLKNGAKVFEEYVRPCRLDLLRVAAHYAVSSLFEDYAETTNLNGYYVESHVRELTEAGIQKMVMGRALIRSQITLEEMEFSFAVLHLGDHNLNGGVRRFLGEELFSQMIGEITEAFARSDIPEVFRLIDKHFEAHNYSLWHLFKEEQRKVLNLMLSATLEDAEVSHRRLYERHYPMMNVLKEMNIPIPKALSTSVEFTLNRDLQNSVEGKEFDPERFQRLMAEVSKWPVELDKTTLAFVAEKKIKSLLEGFYKEPGQAPGLEGITEEVRLLTGLSLNLDIWEAQNLYFLIAREHRPAWEEGAGRKEPEAMKCLKYFSELGQCLQVKGP